MKEAVTLENVYRILLNFAQFFDTIDEDGRNLLREEISHVETLVLLSRSN